MSSESVPVFPDDGVKKRLLEFKIELDPNICYRLTSLFPKLTGWGSNREIKSRAKLIRLVEPKLKQMLLNGEEVLYVAKGIQYSLAENYLMGALWAQVLNQTVFVLTNARLLMMRSNGRGQPKDMFWVIYYSEIQDFKARWTGMLNLKLRDQKKYTFTGFLSLDRKSMPQIFQNAMDDYRRLNVAPSVTQSRENLCRHCFHVVSKGEFLCENCGTEYWKPRDLALRSLLFPSWGDICMKHYGLAFFELLGYLFSWGKATIFLMGDDIEVGLLCVALIFVVEHPLDAVLTYMVASKGLNHRRDPDPERISYESAEHSM